VEFISTILHEIHRQVQKKTEFTNKIQPSSRHVGQIINRIYKYGKHFFLFIHLAKISRQFFGIEEFRGKITSQALTSLVNITRYTNYEV